MTEERLQKLIAGAGMASRREAESWIRAGQVTVNGAVSKLGDKADAQRDAIKARGRLVVPITEHRSYLLNKPIATVCSRKDPEGRTTVFDCLPPTLRKGLFTIGRLDWDSEGALILTTDGGLAQRVAHPKHEGVKRYLVKVKGVPSEDRIGRMTRGVALYGKKTLPARIQSYRMEGERRSKKNSWWTIDLQEGRSRQIREMFFRAGHPVSRLRRVSIGGLSLGNLLPGKWRELTESDLEALLRRGRSIKATARSEGFRDSRAKSADKSKRTSRSRGAAPSSRGTAKPGKRSSKRSGAGPKTGSSSRTSRRPDRPGAASGRTGGRPGARPPKGKGGTTRRGPKSK